MTSLQNHSVQPRSNAQTVRTIFSNVVYSSVVRMGGRNVAQRLVPGQIGRHEEDLEVHHVVNDNLGSCVNEAVPSNIRIVCPTWKSVGSAESQLRVQPTIGLNLPAR